MAEKRKWEVVEERTDGSTTRLELPEARGWLYRVLEWESDGAFSMSVVFVPDARK